MKNQAGTTAPGQLSAEAAALRVMQRCDALAKCTEEPGRITRTFLCAAAKDAQGLVRGWMEACGMQVRVDGVGNIVGRFEPRRTSVNSVEPHDGPTTDSPQRHGDTETLVIGSHLDTVPNAGKYDGILGVMAGIGVVEMFGGGAGQELPFAIEVVGFSEEEGVRFGKPYIGSKGFVGKLDAGWMRLTDKDGVTVEEAIRGFGISAGGELPGKMRGYVELHIEQGPVLEEMDDAVGIVSAIAGQTRMSVRMEGRAGHAGTVPMSMRTDALAAAAEAILVVEKIGRESAGLVATVGRIEAAPNASNVIPGSVELSLDVRHADDGARKKASDAIEMAISQIAGKRKVNLRVVSRGDFPAVKMDPHLTGLLKHAAMEQIDETNTLVSGAGHDAAIMAEMCPAAMLFVRNPGGISHHPEESVAQADVAVALRVLYSFVLRLANA